MSENHYCFLFNLCQLLKHRLISANILTFPFKAAHLFPFSVAGLSDMGLSDELSVNIYLAVNSNVHVL